MIRIINYRLIIEKHDTHEKYYPRVISFNTVDDSPLSEAPSATITIMSSSNLNGVETVTHVEFDDIVRLQTSIKFHDQEKDVWIDFFEGRVQNQSKALGENNEIELSGVGHIIEAKTAMYLADKTYSNVDATTILQDVCSRLSRIQYNAAYAQTGLIVEEYNVVAQQNFVLDTFQEMEKVSGNKRRIGVRTKYSAGGGLQACYLTWSLFSTTPTTQYAVIEGTPRLVSASVDVVGEEVYTYQYVRGGTDASNNQYVGSAVDSSSEYGARYTVNTQTWVKSSALCKSIATGLLSESEDPYISIQAELEFTPDAHVGDFVQVNFISLDIKGVKIDGYYSVKRVTHSFSGGNARTKLDLGRIKKSAYDYLAQNITKVVKTAYKNQVK